MSSNYNDTLSTIATYEKQMRISALETAEQSLTSGEVLHSANAISFMLSVLGQ
jgi:hypothetical protein